MTVPPIDTDLAMVAGVVTVALAAPSAAASFASYQQSVLSVLLCLAGIGLIGLALARRPGPSAIGDVPEAFVRVIGRALR